jgi:hypothetical protein
VYLAKLSETNKSDASLLKANFDELRRDPETSNSIITTWQISFEHISKIRPSAADLLSLMSFFDHRAIPKTLLRTQDPVQAVPSPKTLSEAPTKMSSAISAFTAPNSEVQGIANDTPEDVELERDISMLHDFHLLAVEVGTNDLEMHPLVHLSARKWLELHKKEDEWLNKSIYILRCVVPRFRGDITSEYLQQWKKLYPHVRLTLEYKPKSHATWLHQMHVLKRASELPEFMGLYGGIPETEILARRLCV